MSSVGGQITINLYSQDRYNPVEIHSTRALHASRILVGKTPDQVLSTVPLLFSLCGIAQSHAAYLAIEQKLGKEKSPGQETARELLLLAENAREYLFRLFLDAPRLFHLDKHNVNLSYLSHLTNDFNTVLFVQGKAFSLNSRLNDKLENVIQLIDALEKFLVDNIYDKPIDIWLGYKKDRMQQWAKAGDTLAAMAMNRLFNTEWGAQGGADCSVLPALENRALLKLFNTANADHFIAQPEWQGQCFETTALSRQLEHPLIEELCKTYSSGLLPRWMARLIELATIPVQMRLLLKQLMKDERSVSNISNALPHGIAQVEAARGRLIHRVDIDKGIINQYQILAPTEWNFHPRGMLSQCLGKLNTNNKQELERLAHIMINAYDPCVGYQLRVH